MSGASEAANGVVPGLSCAPMYRLRRDEKTGVWQPEGSDPQFLVSLGDTPLLPGLYRFTTRIDASGNGIQPCLYVANNRRWTETSKIDLQSPLADGVWSAVIDVGSDLRELRFDPVDAQVDFTLGPVRLEKLDDVDAVAFLIRALVERHTAAQLPGARERLIALIARGDMIAVRGWLVHGDEPESADELRAISNARYAEWVARYDTPDAQELTRMSEAVAGWARRPLISIVMPVYNPAEEWLRRCLDSVRAQAYPDWELCIADDASTEPHVRTVLDEYVARDSRIKVKYREGNGHISAASNSALELVTGAYVALLDHDDELAPHALFRVALAVLAHPQGRIFYSDEDKLGDSAQRFDPYFKPDWNPDLFLSHNFISHLGVYEIALIREVGGFRLGYEGSQDYDLALRCIERLRPAQIVHIPHVLYHWRAIHGSTARAVHEKDYAADAARKALREHLRRTACKAEVEHAPAGYRVRRMLQEPRPGIDVIIAARDGDDALHACVGSILDKSTYSNFGITIVGDPQAENLLQTYLREIGANARVKVFPPDAPFNFPRMVNAAVARSEAGLIVLLDHSIEVATGDWLEEMAAHAIRPEVGVVGAKVYRAEGTIRDAGIVLGLCGLAGHIYRGEPHDARGQMGRAQLIQNYSAVAAACLMVERTKFNAAGGLDENLQAAFHDVDLCLKLRARGCWTVWTPFAGLVQRAEPSCGGENAAAADHRLQADAMRMRNAWSAMLDDDPAYNPNLSLSRESPELAFPPRVSTAAVRGRGFVDDSRIVPQGGNP